MKKILLWIGLAACINFLSARLLAQEAATTPIVIDTDCATDDFRAIAAMLSSSDFKVLGIECTNGGLSTAERASAL